MIKPPVWTWEVPLYFWFGGIAAGSSFVALACDLAGDHRSARIARRVALGALVPSPPLLILDLGRPERFYNMLRIFKPRSPMSMGAWCLTVFGGLATAAVGADLIGRRREARALGAANAVVGGYLGSYTGVLLAVDRGAAVGAQRLFLGPIFVTTATPPAPPPAARAVGDRPRAGPPTRHALARRDRRDRGRAAAVDGQRAPARPARASARGRPPGQLFHAAKWSVRLGLAAQLARRRRPDDPARRERPLPGWRAAVPLRLGRGRPSSARDDRVVAEMARSGQHGD